MQLISTIEIDNEGFLKNTGDWNETVATEIAQQENIILLEEHWELIRAARQFYVTYQTSPSMRALVKYVASTLSPDKGKSIYLLQLFPSSPAKILSKIAGLPKPTNCL